MNTKLRTQFKEMCLIAYGLGDRFDISKFNRIKNDWTKPHGGMWATPITATYGWDTWCRLEKFDLKRLNEKFTFWYRGTFLEINDLQDAMRMLWYNRHKNINIPYPNFELMEKLGVDAIHLTEVGQQKTRLTQPYNLYGWDCECVLIMNPNGASTGQLGTGEMAQLYDKLTKIA